MKLRAFMGRQCLFQVMAVRMIKLIDHEDAVMSLTSFRPLARQVFR